MIFFNNCRNRIEQTGKDVKIEWEGKNAVGVLVPLKLLQENTGNDYSDQLSVYLADHLDHPVMGEWNNTNHFVEFKPLVPFTPGSVYEIYANQQQIGSFEIGSKEHMNPEVITIYPSGDAVPENLLKIFIRFSVPMSEGEAIQNINVVDLDSGDTLEGTFLDLQPELWNEDNTLLTLWLDPGRIKRGLIPNRELGVPLIKGRHYRLIINSGWKGANGLDLSRSYIKEFYTIDRDSRSPDINKWKLLTPEVGSDQLFKVEFGEPLDAILAIEAIQIMDSDGQTIPGDEILLEDETVYTFRPEEPWRDGKYLLKVESRLEDRAGNNLNRLFDEEMDRGKENLVGKEIYERVFVIEK